MVIVNAGATPALVNLYETDVGYTETVTAEPALFEFIGNQQILGDWDDTYDWVIRVHGTGFTYDEDGFPTGGTVTSIEIDPFGPEDPFEAGIVITGLSVSITDLVVQGSLTEQTDAFWSTVLSGDDTIIGGSELSLIAGDFLIVDEDETLIGGDDEITAPEASGAMQEFGHYILGDAYTVYGELVGGDDTITATSSGAAFTIIGDAYNVQYGGTLTAGDDFITVESGDQTHLCGDVDHLSPWDVVVAGNDTIIGSDTGNDSIYGDADLSSGVLEAGKDTLKGRGGDDLIVGDVGEIIITEFGDCITIGNDDELIGGKGNDTLIGDFYEISAGAIYSGGKDLLDGGKGDDSLDGGEKRDTLLGGKGDDTLIAGNGADSVEGGKNRDSIEGGGGDDLLRGGAGRDTVMGGKGDDEIKGGDKDDVLNGGKGVDTLSGGTEADTFVWTDKSETGITSDTRDLIRDFEQGTDIIDLSGIDARNGGGDEAFLFIGVSAFSGTAGELRATTTSSKTILRGDTDGDGAEDFEIALKGLYTLTEDDFIL